MRFLVTWLHFEAVAKLFPDSTAGRLATGVYSHLRRHHDDFGVQAVVIPDSFQVQRSVGFDFHALTGISRSPVRRTQLDVAVGVGSSDLLEHVVDHANALAVGLPMHIRMRQAPQCPVCDHDMWLIWPSYFCGMCAVIIPAEGT